jgi:aldose sugar dehydrogenase
MLRLRWLGVLALVTGLVIVSAGQVAAAEEEEVARCRRPRACWITAFAFTPGGRSILYVERFTGEVRRFTPATGKDTRWARVRDVAGGGERGVLGLAVDPHWPGQRRVYVYFTEAHPQRNRIVRLEKLGRRLDRSVLATIPAASFHNGGVLHFGPDGRLFAVTGDAGSPDRSQQVTNPAGKVLRMTDRGRRPSDNPFRGSTAFSVGHRNSFGFAWDPGTGRLWQTENGPGCDDEINLVLRGRNYGWGAASECPDTTESGKDPVEPALRINPLLAPTGATFCDGCGLGPVLDGDLLVGTFNDERLYAFDLNADRDGITSRSVVLDRRDAVLAVESAPDGSVYFSDVRGIYRVA